MQRAETLPDPLNQSVRQLLEELPILGGLPLAGRETNDAGTQFTTIKSPTAVSVKGRITQGSFRVVYRDRVACDQPGRWASAPDEVDVVASFTDPEGTHYELVVERLWQPPIPDLDTG